MLGEKWNQPKSIPECLEILVWTCYEWKVQEEKEVVKYILRNASSLKRATFSESELNSEDRVEMVNELESMVRASKSCQLLFK